MISNTDVRKTAKSKGVLLWEIANSLHISEATMTRKMRRELSSEEKQRILTIIDKIAAEKQAV